MGMTIDLAIKVLKRMIKKGIAYDDGYAFEPLAQDEEKACSIAIDTMNRHQMMQAEYENRLKADMVAMLRFLWNDIENLDAPICDYASSDCISKWQVHEVIQQKINALRGGENDKTTDNQ